jgi:uncharacterized coiled-coil DUF342 family protein
LLTMLEDERGASIALRMERDELKVKLAEVTKNRNELLLENDDLRSERDKAEEKEKVMAAAFGVAVYERDELRKEVNALRKGSVDLSSEHNVIKRNFDTPVTIQIQGVLEQVRDDFYSSIEALDRDSISAYIDGVETGLNNIETAFVVNSQLCESRRQKVEELTRERDALMGERDRLRYEMDRMRERYADQCTSEMKATAMLSEAISERDELRAKLERVRGLQRWYHDPYVGSPGEAVKEDDDGDYVRWSDIAAIVGEDGEA